MLSRVLHYVRYREKRRLGIWEKTNGHVDYEDTARRVHELTLNGSSNTLQRGVMQYLLFSVGRSSTRGDEFVAAFLVEGRVACCVEEFCIFACRVQVFQRRYLFALARMCIF